MNTKLITTFLVFGLLSVGMLHAQDWERVDRHSYAVRSEDPATLSRLLTQNLSTDRERARVIFRWIADNIEYYRLPARPNRFKDKLHGYQLPEDTGALPSLTERVARKVLADRRTHCEGFARLYQSLCEHAGVAANIVTGYAAVGRSGKYSSNHAWNTVYFDSAWHLLDVTWAAGYFNQRRPESIAYANALFMAEPDRFFQQHVPDDLRWTLLTEAPVSFEMQRSPYKPRSFVKYGISSYNPTKGVLQAQLGDTLKFWVRQQFSQRSLAMAPDSIWDETYRWLDPQVQYVEAENPAASILMYQIVIDNPQLCWIQLMLNQDVILRYRIKLEKESESLVRNR